jgi:hypothetical protein
VKLARWLILLGSVVLFCGALLHLVGYRFLVPVVANTGIDPKVLGALKCVWLVFSVQILILSPALVWISRRPGGRSVLLYLALMPLIDGILMYYFVGSFIGSNIVAVGTVLLLVGGWLLPHDNISPQ